MCVCVCVCVEIGNIEERHILVLTVTLSCIDEFGENHPFLYDVGTYIVTVNTNI